MTWAAPAPSSDLVLTSIEPGAGGAPSTDGSRSTPSGRCHGRSRLLIPRPARRAVTPSRDIPTHPSRRRGAWHAPVTVPPAAQTGIDTPPTHNHLRLGEATSCQRQPSARRGPDAFGTKKLLPPRKGEGWEGGIPGNQKPLSRLGRSVAVIAQEVIFVIVDIANASGHHDSMTMIPAFGVVSIAVPRAGRLV
jgi:hypothetical protein